LALAKTLRWLFDLKTVFECCVRDSSGILFCPVKAKKIQRRARPGRERPNKIKRIVTDEVIFMEM
jgi:hypothetical protein